MTTESEELEKETETLTKILAVLQSAKHSEFDTFRVALSVATFVTARYFGRGLRMGLTTMDECAQGVEEAADALFRSALCQIEKLDIQDEAPSSEDRIIN